MVKSRCSVVEDDVQCANDAGYSTPVPMCPKHYQRWRRLGDPAAPVRVQVRCDSPEERRARANAITQSWRKRNPDRVKATAARARKTTKYQERIKQWNEENKSRRYKRGKQWRDRNPEKLQAWNQRWRAENPEKAREAYRRAARRRKARRKAVVVVSYKEIDIFERDKWVCQLCRKKVNRRLRHPDLMAPTIDHIIPISQGGADAPFNVQLAHFCCNSAKGARAVGEQLRLLG